MLLDTTGMPPMLEKYYKGRQMEIIAKWMRSKFNPQVRYNTISLRFCLREGIFTRRIMMVLLKFQYQVLILLLLLNMEFLMYKDVQLSCSTFLDA